MLDTGVLDFFSRYLGCCSWDEHLCVLVFRSCTTSEACFWLSLILRGTSYLIPFSLHLVIALIYLVIVFVIKVTTTSR